MSVLTLVTDPDFQTLSSADQQAALTGIDPDFGKLNSSDLGTVVSRLQKQALSRPDLMAPPGIPKPQVNMQPASGAPQPPTNYQAIPGTGETPAQTAKGFPIALAEGGALAATMGSSGPIEGAVGTVGKWVAANPIKSLLAIQAAKQVPGVGEKLNKIPGVELLPLLASEGKAGAEAAARNKLGFPSARVAVKPGRMATAPQSDQEFWQDAADAYKQRHGKL